LWVDWCDGVEDGAVDFVAMENQVVFLGEVDDLDEKGFGEDGAGWVVRVAGDDLDVNSRSDC
jgi:hypothetical protein